MADSVLIQFRTDLDKMRQELDAVKSKVKGVGDEAKKVGKDTQDSLTNVGSIATKIGGYIAGAFALDRIVSFSKEVVAVTAEFQKMSSVLTNSLGSSSKAQSALTMIMNFAAKTPFSVKELTSSFVKLVNQGFKPTEVEMRKLGDLASSTGKSFDQLAEAIIDAQVGEFERLKEFGIRAKKEGDKVTFTFKGVKEQVDFTQESIQKYVLSLGDAVGVSGSMEAISKTLGGQISNLGDAWDALLLTIGKSNEGVLSGALQFFTDLVILINKGIKDEKELADEAARLNEAIISKEAITQFENYISKIKLATGANFDLNKSQENYVKSIQKSIDLEKQKPSDDSGDKLLNLILERDAVLESIKAKKEQNDLGKDSIKTLEAELKLINERAAVGDKENAQRNQEAQAIELKIKRLKELGIETEEQKKKRESDQKKFVDNLKEDEKLALASEEAMSEAEMKANVNSVNAHKQKLAEQEKADKEYLNKVLDNIEEEAKAKKDKEDRERERIKEENAFILDSATTTINTIAEIQRTARQAELDANLNATEEARRQELNNKNLTEQQIAGINKKYDEQRKKIQLDAWRKEKNAQLLMATINTAAAVIAAYAQTGNPIAAAAAGLTGAAQIAVISSQPEPKFHEGAIDIRPNKKNKKGEFSAVLMERESVINPRATAKYKAELEAANSMALDDLIYMKYVVPALQEQKKAFEKQQQSGFASNVANSFMLQNGFKDSNIVEMLKRVNSTSKQSAEMITTAIKQTTNRNVRYS